MDIRIFTPALAFCGVCDQVISLSASESFAGAGRFAVRVPLGDARRFMRDGIVMLPGTEDGFVIESILEDGGEGTAAVEGRSVLAFFARRALPSEITYSGPAEALLLRLAAQYGAAALPGPLSTAEHGGTAEVNAALGGTSLLSAMRSVCTAAGVGMRLRFDADGGGFVFMMREKKARAHFLSRSAGNLRSIVRTSDYRNYVNRVIVVGNGSHSVTVSAAGLFSDGVDDASEAVRELYGDASRIAMSRYETEAAYLEALAAEGKRILASHRPTRTVTLQTDGRTAAALSPGDVCPVADDTLGIRASAVCLEKSVTLENGRMHRAVTLSFVPGESDGAAGA